MESNAYRRNSWIKCNQRRRRSKKNIKKNCQDNTWEKRDTTCKTTGQDTREKVTIHGCSQCQNH